MKEHNDFRRGLAFGVATLTGLSAAVFGVVGISEHVDLGGQQRDVALANAADVAHNALIDAQVAQDNSLFDNDVALQQSIYYWALEPTANGGLGLPDDSLLFPGSDVDPQNSIFNGAFSRFTEANLVNQAMMQVQLDHLLGVNQTLGVGGYETDIANVLYADLSGAGIPSSGALHGALDVLNLSGADPVDVTSFSAFQSALSDLESALTQNAWSDLFGMFSAGSGDATDPVADLFGLF